MALNNVLSCFGLLISSFHVSLQQGKSAVAVAETSDSSKFRPDEDLRQDTVDTLLMADLRATDKVRFNHVFVALVLRVATTG